MKTNANHMTVQLSDDREVFLSYGTPVAAFVPGRGYVATDRKYSVTTSRHVNRYLDGRGTRVPHAEFVEMVRPLVTR